jgi:hypothetical protein
MAATSSYQIMARGSEKQLDSRQIMQELYTNSPVPKDEFLVNMALYARSSVVAKWLYMNELYELIINTPGVIMEFGVWWGQNLALFESFRGIYEPYNYTRRIIGFDTFEGYPAVKTQDGTSEYAAVGGYAVTNGYESHLQQVLNCHEQENTMGHIQKFELLKGDVTQTIDQYLADHPETILALAYFDLALYEPTKKCLEAIRPYLTKGSVIAMDELNCREFPGETQAFREVFGLDRYRLIRSRYLPDRAYIIID